MKQLKMKFSKSNLPFAESKVEVTIEATERESSIISTAIYNKLHELDYTLLEAK